MFAMGFASVMDDFHWYFRAVLVARIAMLKYLGNSKSKIFQALRAYPDPTLITLRLRKIRLFFSTFRLMSVSDVENTLE